VVEALTAIRSKSQAALRKIEAAERAAAEAEEKERMLRKAVGFFQRRGLSMAWTAWKENVAAIKEERRMLKMAAVRMSKGTLSKAFYRWLEMVEEIKQQERILKKAVGKFMNRHLAMAWDCWMEIVDKRRQMKDALARHDKFAEQEQASKQMQREMDRVKKYNDELVDRLVGLTAREKLAVESLRTERSRNATEMKHQVTRAIALGARKRELRESPALSSRVVAHPNVPELLASTLVSEAKETTTLKDGSLGITIRGGTPNVHFSASRLSDVLWPSRPNTTSMGSTGRYTASGSPLNSPSTSPRNSARAGRSGGVPVGTGSAAAAALGSPKVAMMPTPPRTAPSQGLGIISRGFRTSSPSLGVTSAAAVISPRVSDPTSMKVRLATAAATATRPPATAWSSPVTHASSLHAARMRASTSGVLQHQPKPPSTAGGNAGPRRRIYV